MKKAFILIFAFALLNSCFEDLRSREFYSSGDFSYNPQKDTFNVGDTIWMSFSIPKNINNDSFNLSLEIDTIPAILGLYILEVLNENDTVGSGKYINADEMIVRNGKLVDKHIFIKDENCYIFEFGYLLKESGIFFITSSYYKDDYSFIDLNDIPGLGPHCDDNCSRTGGARFHSTFSETGEGWFQIVVNE